MNLIPDIGVSVPNNWSISQLGEQTAKIGSGATPRGGSSVYVNEGTTLIRSQNVYDHSFKDDGLVYIDDSAAHALRGVSVQEGDVLINITGDSILRTTVVPRRVLPARVNQHVAIVRTDESLNPVFAQKWLATPKMKSYMLGLSSGGTRKAITKGHLQSLPIPVPPMREQQAIAATLSVLDDKIESNRQQADLVYQLQDAKWSAISDTVPSVMFTDLLEPHLGGTPSRKIPEHWNGDVQWASVKEMSAADQGIIVNTAENISEEVSRKSKRFNALPGKSVFLSARGTVGNIVVNAVPCAINQSAYAFNTKKYGTALVRLAVAGSVETLKQHAHGSTFDAITTADLSSVQIPDLRCFVNSPLAEELERSEDIRLHLSIENRRLALLRDTLLPELMSGRIRVAEARDAVQDATDTELPEVSDV